MAIRRKWITLCNRSLLFGIIIGTTLILFINKAYEHKEGLQQLKEYYVKKLNRLMAEKNASLITRSMKQPSRFGTDSLETFIKVHDVTECQDKPLVEAYKQRGKYWVLYNYVKADKQFKCYESITYTTQGDYTNLDNLITLAERWRGPISVALYAPGSDFQATVNSIAHLRNCESDFVKKYVTFHLFFSSEHIPKGDHGIPLKRLYKDMYDCTKKPPYKEDLPNTFKNKKDLSFPINVARNVARESVQTHFVFASDIELYPPNNFIQKFLNMVDVKINVFLNSAPKIFVLPVFEIHADANIPENKTQLQMMYKDNKALLFHSDICPQCHQFIDGNEWIEASETDGIDIFSVGKRMGKYQSWEAFYVGTNREPLFDERLTWESESSRVTQAYLLCLLNYDYMVLDNAFLVYKPSNKKRKVQEQKHSTLIQETKDMIKGYIKNEFHLIYGSRDGCKL